jgi:hypothetical protein
MHMSKVMDILEEAESHIKEYQEATSASLAAPQSHFRAILVSIRARMSWGVPARAPLETGLDILARRYPYAFILALCG